MSETIYIDGSLGEGGGQILRTSLSLSMCIGTPIRIESIRAGRAKPGLLRQHLTAARAAARISNGQLYGAELGSTAFEFTPGPINAGHYEFGIGSAGSTTLVLQTLLPALLQADGVSTLVLQGGTHNGMAPSFDFLQQAFLPALTRMGAEVEFALEEYGFFPQGGGKVCAVIKPWAQRLPYIVTRRGEHRCLEAVASSAHVPGHVVRREIDQIKKRMAGEALQCRTEQVDSPGPGNIVSLRLHSDNLTEVFESLGEKRVSAERVADRAVRQLKAHLATDIPVGEYLADQLLLPMVLGAGGEFVTHPLSQHSLTNIQVIERFLGPNRFLVTPNEGSPGAKATGVTVSVTP